jgi:predicted secreted protein
MPSTTKCETCSKPDTITEPEITVLAHCLLNPFARVKGLRPVEFRPEGPLIQLPCPEALYLGLDRWASTRNQLDVPEFRRFCRSLITQYADLLEMLARQGKRIKIVGLAGSPSCGIDTTSLGYTGGRVRECEHEHVPGQGIFMEELMAELERRGISFEADEIGAKEALD